jgi:hypothetical protein
MARAGGEKALPQLLEKLYVLFLFTTKIPFLS